MKSSGVSQWCPSLRSATSPPVSPLKATGHNVSVNYGCHLGTPIHVHITSKNTEFRKLQALKRYGTQIFA